MSAALLKATNVVRIGAHLYRDMALSALSLVRRRDERVA